MTLVLSLVFGALAALSFIVLSRPLDPRAAMTTVGQWLLPLRLKIQREIVFAGLTERLTAETVVGLQIVLAVLLGAGGVFILPGGWAAAGLLFVFGLQAPRWWLRAQVSRRQRAIFLALPYTIDLLTVVVEAGQDFGVAIARVVDRAQPGPLKDELAAMLSQIRLGRSRREALKDLAARTGLQELSSLVMALIQTDQLGVSLGPALRIQSDELRQARARRAEKLAMQAPVKMLVPLLGCIFPSVFIMLLLPIGLKLLAPTP